MYTTFYIYDMPYSRMPHRLPGAGHRHGGTKAVVASAGARDTGALQRRQQRHEQGCHCMGLGIPAGCRHLPVTLCPGVHVQAERVCDHGFAMRRCLCDEYQHYAFCEHVAMDLIHRQIIKVPPMFKCHDGASRGVDGAARSHRTGEYWRRDNKKKGVFGWGTGTQGKGAVSAARHGSGDGPVSAAKRKRTGTQEKGSVSSSKRQRAEVQQHVQDHSDSDFKERPRAPPRKKHKPGVHTGASDAVGKSRSVGAGGSPSVSRSTGTRGASATTRNSGRVVLSRQVEDAIDRMSSMSLAAIQTKCTGFTRLGKSAKTGNGLFANRNIAAGTAIAILSSGPVTKQPAGRSVKLAESQFQQYPKSSSIMRRIAQSEDEASVQAVLAGAGCMANEADSQHEVNTAIGHVAAAPVGSDERGAVTVLVSIKEIKMGEEVLTDYGACGKNEGAWGHRSHGGGKERR